MVDASIVYEYDYELLSMCKDILYMVSMYAE